MILSGGGTAGHIYPALALADELRSRGVELSFVGTASGPEARLASDANIDFSAISTAGFDRSKPLTLITSGVKALWGIRQALSLLKKKNPSAVVCFGGYVSVPVGIAAAMCKIPLVVHEQNSHIGMTNRLLAASANYVALTYPETAGLPKDMKAVCEFVGNPVRQSIHSADGTRARAELNIPDTAQVLLVFGGSRGARKINQATVLAAQHLLMERPDLHIIHGTGNLEYDAVIKGLEKFFETCPELEPRYHVLPYIEKMGDIMKGADLVVARAGATSIAELTVLGKPSVLIPYPYATDDHQTTNAQALVNLGGARLIADKQLLEGYDPEAEGVDYTSGTNGENDSVFTSTLLELTGDAQLRAVMAAHAVELGKPDAAKRLADAIVELVNKEK